MKKALEHNPGRKLFIHSNKNLPFFFRVFFVFLSLILFVYCIFSEDRKSLPCASDTILIGFQGQLIHFLLRMFAQFHFQCRKNKEC